MCFDKVLTARELGLTTTGGPSGVMCALTLVLPLNTEPAYVLIALVRIEGLGVLKTLESVGNALTLGPVLLAVPILLLVNSSADQYLAGLEYGRSVVLVDSLPSFDDRCREFLLDFLFALLKTRWNVGAGVKSDIGGRR